MKEKGEGWWGRGKWRRPASWLLGGGLLILVAYYALHALVVDAKGPVHLVVYAFSTQEEVLTQGIFPAFEAAWQAETGRDLSLEGVFGASGTLAGQINLGAPADVVILSNAEHVDWLKVGRRVRQDAEPVLVGCTPMVIVVRPGNPYHVAEFADLAQPGLNLLHADPNTSGAGEWSVLAEFGSKLREGDAGRAGNRAGNREAAGQQLAAIWRNVRLMAPSARAAMTLFELGAGDALITYEQDTLLAQQRGTELEIVRPSRTIVAQHAAVVVDDNVSRAERPAAEALVRYLLSPEGQQILAEHGLRDPNCQSSVLPGLTAPFAVEDLGGWSQAYLELVEGLWQKQIEPGLEPSSGPTLLKTE